MAIALLAMGSLILPTLLLAADPATEKTDFISYIKTQ